MTNQDLGFTLPPPPVAFELAFVPAVDSQLPALSANWRKGFRDSGEEDGNPAREKDSSHHITTATTTGTVALEDDDGSISNESQAALSLAEATYVVLRVGYGVSAVRLPKSEAAFQDILFNAHSKFVSAGSAASVANAATTGAGDDRHSSEALLYHVAGMLLKIWQKLVSAPPTNSTEKAGGGEFALTFQQLRTFIIGQLIGGRYGSSVEDVKPFRVSRAMKHKSLSRASRIEMMEDRGLVVISIESEGDSPAAIRVIDRGSLGIVNEAALPLSSGAITCFDIVSVGSSSSAASLDDTQAPAKESTSSPRRPAGGAGPGGSDKLAAAAGAGRMKAVALVVATADGCVRGYDMDRSMSLRLDVAHCSVAGPEGAAVMSFSTVAGQCVTCLRHSVKRETVVFGTSKGGLLFVSTSGFHKIFGIGSMNGDVAKAFPVGPGNAIRQATAKGAAGKAADLARSTETTSMAAAVAGQALEQAGSPSSSSSHATTTAVYHRHPHLHEDCVTGLEFDASGECVFSCSLDRHVIQYSMIELIPLRRLVGHRLGIVSLTLNGAYNTLITSGLDCNLFVWPLEVWDTKPLPLVDAGHPQTVPAVVVRTVSAKPIVVSMDGRGAFRVWDLRSLRCVCLVTCEPELTRAELSQLHWQWFCLSQKTMEIVTTANRRLYALEYDLDDMAALSVDIAHESGVLAIAVVPNGGDLAGVPSTTVASVARGDLNLWDASTGMSECRFRDIAADGITCMLWLGAKAGSFVIGTTSGSVKLYSSVSFAVTSICVHQAQRPIVQLSDVDGESVFAALALEVGRVELVDYDAKSTVMKGSAIERKMAPVKATAVGCIVMPHAAGGATATLTTTASRPFSDNGDEEGEGARGPSAPRSRDGAVPAPPHLTPTEDNGGCGEGYVLLGEAQNSVSVWSIRPRSGPPVSFDSVDGDDAACRRRGSTVAVELFKAFGFPPERTVTALVAVGRHVPAFLAGDDGGSIHLWTFNGQNIWRLQRFTLRPSPLTKMPSAIRTMLWSEAVQLCLMGDDAGYVHCYDVRPSLGEANRLQPQLPFEAIVPDGLPIQTQVRTCQPPILVSVFEAHPEASITSLVVLPFTNVLVTGSNDCRIALWSLSGASALGYLILSKIGVSAKDSHSSSASVDAALNYNDLPPPYGAGLTEAVRLAQGFDVGSGDEFTQKGVNGVALFARAEILRVQALLDRNKLLRESERHVPRPVPLKPKIRYVTQPTSFSGPRDTVVQNVPQYLGTAKLNDVASRPSEAAYLPPSQPLDPILYGPRQAFREFYGRSAEQAALTYEAHASHRREAAGTVRLRSRKLPATVEGGSLVVHSPRSKSVEPLSTHVWSPQAKPSRGPVDHPVPSICSRVQLRPLVVAPQAQSMLMLVAANSAAPTTTPFLVPFVRPLAGVANYQRDHKAKPF